MMVKWRYLRLPDGTLHATIICPKCGEELVLADKETGRLHAIAPDGTVTPSVYHKEKHCGWHEFIKLPNWKQEAK
jgi:ribosomal protein S27AE